jgi:hypothetical protein
VFIDDTVFTNLRTHKVDGVLEAIEAVAVSAMRCGLSRKRALILLSE